MEVIFGILAVVASCLVVFFVTKLHRTPDEEETSDIPHEDSGRRHKKNRGKVAKGNQGKAPHDTVDNLKATTLPKPTLSSTKETAPILEKPIQPLQSKQVDSKNDENNVGSELRRRSNKKQKPTSYASDKENARDFDDQFEKTGEEDQSENSIADIISRAMDAEKKLAVSEKRVGELTNRLKEVEFKAADNEKRLMKSKEEEFSSMMENKTKNLKESHSAVVRRLEAQVTDLKKKAEDILQDKLFLQNEVADNARRKISSEKEMEKLQNSIGERDKQISKLATEVKDLQHLLSDSSSTKKASAAGETNLQDSIVKEITQCLPEYKPGSFADCLRIFVSKQLEQGKRRVESEAERAQSSMKQSLIEAEAKIKALSQEIELTKNEVQSKSRHLEESEAKWERRCAEADDKVIVLSRELEGIKNEAACKGGDVQAKQDEINNLKGEIANLERKIQTMNTEFDSRLAQSIEEERRRVESEWSSRMSNTEADGSGKVQICNESSFYNFVFF